MVTDKEDKLYLWAIASGEPQAFLPLIIIACSFGSMLIDWRGKEESVSSAK